MFEIIIIALLLLGGGLAFGVAFRKRPVAGLSLAVGFGIVVGIGVGDWSGYRTMFTRGDLFLYACASILPYFAIVLIPAICGAVVGVLFGRRYAKAQRQQPQR